MFDKLGPGLGIIILLMMIIIVLLTVITISMSMRLSRLTKKYKEFMKGNDVKNMEALILARFEEMDKISEQNRDNTADIMTLKKHLNKTLTHYGVVKYDAFDDVGGRMSFALAMLDNDNSGFILDTIHSRDNCFVYLKEIVKGESYIMLSNEEIQALKEAVNNRDEDDLDL